MSLIAAGSVGAAIHWKTAAPVGNMPADASVADKVPNPSHSLEKDLIRRLNERGIKSDLEVVNAVLELATLYIREKRYDLAAQMFEGNHLRGFPAVAEAQKSFQYPGLYYALLNSLGKGLVLSHRDLPELSNVEFKNAIQAGPAIKPKNVKMMPIDVFLWKYDRWKKATADALERNAKNQNVVKFPDEQLNRYRHYSKAP